MMGAQLHVTKLAAARRQLRTAIRMFFAGEDELAIHTVASAAHRIIADLKKERGSDVVGDSHAMRVFYVVRDYRRGTLPKRLTDDPEAMKGIQEMAEELPITASTKYEDIKVCVSTETARKWWQKRNKVSNFLKHADRDAKAHISLQEVDNLELLSQALASYTDLVQDDLGAEGLVFWMYLNVVTETVDQLPEEYRDMAWKLEELDHDEQLEFCSLVIDGMNETDPQQLASQRFDPKSGPHL
ncbi:MAG: hypothetical protein SWE60_01880 [Thermodesulfobacteriota bacterium]|nr:hypothetical protein [Thermodesulfobacteriota bacterium]